MDTSPISEAEKNQAEVDNLRRISGLFQDWGKKNMESLSPDAASVLHCAGSDLEFLADCLTENKG